MRLGEMRLGEMLPNRRRQQTTLVLVLGHFKLLLWFVKNVTPITVYVVVVVVVRIGAR